MDEWSGRTRDGVMGLTGSSIAIVIDDGLDDESVAVDPLVGLVRNVRQHQPVIIITFVTLERRCPSVGTHLATLSSSMQVRLPQQTKLGLARI